MEKDQVHIRATEFVARANSLFRRIDQANVDHLDVLIRQAFLNLAVIAFEAVFQSLELWPVCVQADAEQSNAKLLVVRRMALSIRAVAVASDG